MMNDEASMTMRSLKATDKIFLTRMADKLTEMLHDFRTTPYTTH